MEAIRGIESRYQVRIAIQQLFEELSTLKAISRFLAARGEPATVPSGATSAPATPAVPAIDAPAPAAMPRRRAARPADAATPQEFMRQQLEMVSRTLNEVVQRQLEYLAGSGGRRRRRSIAARPRRPGVHAVAVREPAVRHPAGSRRERP